MRRLLIFGAFFLLLPYTSCTVFKKPPKKTQQTDSRETLAVTPVKPEVTTEPIGELSATEVVTPQKKTNALKQELVEYAEKHIGSPYKYAGVTPKGFDCSGFTHFVYASKEITLSRDSRSQALEGKPVKLKDIAVGDLLFFKKGGRIFHVALVTEVEEDRYAVIHATSRGIVKDYSDGGAWRNYWQDKVAFARRVLEEE